MPQGLALRCITVSREQGNARIDIYRFGFYPSIPLGYGLVAGHEN
jgi:hypothetical protein